MIFLLFLSLVISNSLLILIFIHLRDMRDDILDIERFLRSMPRRINRKGRK